MNDPIIKQDDFLSFLAGTQESECEKLYTFALDALTFANKVQLYHWSCPSGFHHEKFQEIYEEIRKFADKLVEIVMAMKIQFKVTSKNYLFSDEVYDFTNASVKINNFVEALKEFKKTYSQNVSLENLFADTIESIEHTMGLMQNFS